MNNEFNNQSMNQFENNNMGNQYSNNYNDLNNQNNNKNDKRKDTLIAILVIIVFILTTLSLYFVVTMKDNDVDNKDNIQENKLNYEIKEEVDSSSDAKWSYLYVNNKKVDNIKVQLELESLEVKEFKDLLIVDIRKRKLFAVDKNGNSTEMEYKVSSYNQSFIDYIDSYRIEGNDLYIKVNRRWVNGDIDWYCQYEDKNEVAEYEIKYEYKNGKLENKQVLNEVKISDKYEIDACQGDENKEEQENDSFQLNEKTLNEYYLKTIDIVDEHVVEYRYSAIAKGEFSYDYLKKAYTMKNIIETMKPVGNTDYPCCSPEDYLPSFGLTKEEINKRDKNIWPKLLGGGGAFVSYMYDVSIIRDKYPDIYNDIFNSSFYVKLDSSPSSPYRGYVYDKNLDKVATDGHGGTPLTEKRAIIESKEENNLYKVIFVEGVFFPGENGMLEQTIKEEISYDMNDAEEFLKRNKDKLPNYEIIFEKTGNGYSYKSIKKI